MKKLFVLVLALSFCTSALAQQNMMGGLMDKAKSTDLADITSGPSMTGLLSSLTSNLNVSEEQATGGLASIFSYAKDNLSADDFATIAKQIPGTESLLNQVPDLGGQGAGMGGMGSMLSKAAESLGGTALLAQQFESLGLDPDMVMGYITQIQAYLDTPQGQQAKALLMSSFSGLVSG
ncbi:DUF2780 domain-containing protein [Glaciecola siphonariae]|uniref:DUF2780 domain-containing protein n=1 Tax=Glaciecola siphonariae TaxID=521012 RepID=A0ABV9LUL0_9ALTE